jgi:adenylate kinase family enzyme
MRRVLIFGRGGAGKSTLARRLGEVLQLPVVELDKVYWRADGSPTPVAAWQAAQKQLVAGGAWILDGDLGPSDVVEPRLRAADTIIVLDLAACRCAWRVLRRSRERTDFWRWMLWWRQRSLPRLNLAIQRYAPTAAVVRLQSTREIEEFLRSVT